MSDNARNEILKAVKSALEQKKTLPYPDVRDNEGIMPPLDGHLDELFAQNLIRNGASFLYCENIVELKVTLDKMAETRGWKHWYCWELALQDLLKDIDFRLCRIGKNLDKADVGITGCRALVASTGSILIDSELQMGRATSVFPPVHVVVAMTSQIVYGLKTAISLSKGQENDRPSMISIISGPSRTADIEKTLVKGAHGPKELIVILLENN
jgi:L-lactate dehydrogenase complex protein LldG